MTSSIEFGSFVAIKSKKTDNASDLILLLTLDSAFSTRTLIKVLSETGLYTGDFRYSEKASRAFS